MLLPLPFRQKQDMNRQWKYLYRAVDRDGETLDVMLSAHRSKKAAKRFFKKTWNYAYCNYTS
jgi:transposase-like protein